eukprot:CAMPEP_0177640458 /NCGR_PEP_ID=MMETSP0447-20121125/6553_1 /TAXON_ID=0 /ORGANISM="Stygamoeba regulata, Strain BSH-02190019" /LENGTH=379 /DNA_ID=CAMNT_0019142529 /DNA_START=44 /DNA_END=1184 /DNA_ORIENTATION=-
MANASLVGLSRSLGKNVRLENGQLVARSLSRSHQMYPPILQYLSQTQLSADRLLSICEESDIGPGNLWAEILAHNLISALRERDRDYVGAFNAHIEAVSAFLKVFETATQWTLPAFYVLIDHMRILGQAADEQMRADPDGKPDKLETAARILNRCFGITINDRNPLSNSKKWGTLSVINNLFRIHFKLNNVRLCKNLIRSVDGHGFPPLEKFPISHLVTYKFFLGRVCLFEGNLTKAEDALTFAFERLPRNHVNSKRLCLMYLLPVKLFRGKYPPKGLLKKYQLDTLATIVEAVALGNLKLFNRTMEDNEEEFIRRGILLILEKLKDLVYRNLLFTISTALNTTKIPLTSLQKVCVWLGADMDLDEVECIVANLLLRAT